MRYRKQERRSLRKCFERLELRLLLAATGQNLNPVMDVPENVAANIGRSPVIVPLSATDPNPADVLIFRATSRSAEYYLDQSLGLEFTGDFSLNASETLDEKWLFAENVDNWYFLTPDGGLWRWLGGGLDKGELVASLSPEIYLNPESLYAAEPNRSPAIAIVEGTTLTIVPEPTFSGFFSIELEVSDGCLVDTGEFLVTINPNRAPILVDPGPQSLKEDQAALEVSLVATDIENDPITFSAVPHSTAYYLDQSLGLVFAGDYSLDFGGRDEKWMTAEDGTWYYLTPDGRLWQWQQGALEDDPLIAELSATIYEDPAQLHDAQLGDAPAVVSVAADLLTIEPADDFTGVFSIEVTASDGQLTDSKLMVVTVNENQAPELALLEDQAVFNEQLKINVALDATDGDNDPLEFSVVLHSIEFYLDQTLDFAPTDDFSTNFSGLNEKWIVAADESWYYITPDGRFWKWHGGAVANADLVATLDTATHVDPEMLFDAQPGTTAENPSAKATIKNDVLTIELNAGLVGTFLADVVVSDGSLSDLQSIVIAVTEVMNDAPILADPGDRTILTSIDTVEITLSATDADDDPLTFTAIAHDAEYYLDQSLGLEFGGDLFFNFSGKLNEKWIAGANDRWYYLTPDGILWESVSGGTLDAEKVTSLSPATYANPQVLYDAQPGGAAGSVAITGTTLSVDPNARFVGLLGVEIFVSDGRESDSTLILVTVEPFGIIDINEAPPEKSYDILAQSWFDWLVGDVVAPASFPFDFPLTDTSGAAANDNQVDPEVFFVGGIFGATASRSFNVPVGRNLFIALSASFWTNLPGGDPALGALATKQSINAVDSLTLEVDDTLIPSETLFAQRAAVNNFAATFAPDNWFALATGGLFPAGTTSGHSVDGYWALLPPIAAGNHTIKFTSSANGTFVPEAGFSAQEIAGSSDVSIAFSQNITLNISAVLPASRRPEFGHYSVLANQSSSPKGSLTISPQDSTPPELKILFLPAFERAAARNVDAIMSDLDAAPDRTLRFRPPTTLSTYSDESQLSTSTAEE
jgi:hypothetical protein